MMFGWLKTLGELISSGHGHGLGLMPITHAPPPWFGVKFILSEAEPSAWERICNERRAA